MYRLPTFIRLFSTIRFTKSHQWIAYDPITKKAKIGITDYAQQQLGQIIHIQLPSIGKKLQGNQSASVIQSVKIAADVYTPTAGSISNVNKQVQKNPSLVNDKANQTWLFEVNCSQQPPSNLLTEQEYKKIVN